MKKKNDIHEIILKGRKMGVKKAVELSIRTGIPLVVERKGKIIEIPPKYKYVKVPIKKKSSKK